MKNYKILSTLILSFIINLSINFLKSAEVEGIVKDSKTLQTISNASIFINDKFVTVTNEQGKFNFSIEAGRYSIKVTHVSYEAYSKEIIVKDNETNFIEILLVPLVIELRDVSIIDKKLPAVKEIDNKDIYFGKSLDLGEALTLFPNVSGIRRGSTVLDPVVRGFKYSQLNVLIDGLFQIEGGCPNRMDPTTSRLDPYDVEKIQIVQGPYAFQYGNNFGSTIILKTHGFPEYKSDSLKFSLRRFSEHSPNFALRNHTRLSLGSRKKGFMFYWGKTNYKNYRDGKGNPLKTNANKINFGGKTFVKFSHSTEISLNANYQQGYNVLFAGLPMDERLDNTWFAYATLKTVLPFLKNKETIFQVYKANVEHIMDNKNRSISDTMVAISTVYAITEGARLSNKWQTSTHTLLTTGIEVKNIKKDGKRQRIMIDQPPVNKLIPSATDKLWNNAYINNYAIFSDFTFNKNQHTIFTGFRYDFNSANSDDIIVKQNQNVILSYPASSLKSEYHNFSVGVGYNYKTKNNNEITVMLGRASRSPDMLERFIILLPVGYDNYDYLGNPQLKPETNNEIDVSFLKKIKTIELNATMFASYVENFIIGKRLAPSIQRPLSKGVLGVKQFHNASSAYFYGFEFSSTIPFEEKLFIKLTTAYTAGTITEANRAIIDESKPISQRIIGETKIYNDPLPEIPPLELKTSLLYHLIKNKLYFFLDMRYIAAQNRVSKAFYEEKTPSNAIFNFNANFSPTPKIILGIGVRNIFNHYYYEHLNRRVIGSTQKIYEPGRIFFMNILINID